MILDSRIPSGPIAGKWDRRKFENKLVNPANRRKYDVIVVGTGLAGASAGGRVSCDFGESQQLGANPDW